MTYIRGLLYAIILKFCVEYCSYLAAKIDVMDDISRFKWNSREPILMSRVASSPKAAKRGRFLPSPWIIPLNWPQYDYPLLYHHGACNSSNHVLHFVGEFFTSHLPCHPDGMSGFRGTNGSHLGGGHEYHHDSVGDELDLSELFNLI